MVHVGWQWKKVVYYSPQDQVEYKFQTFHVLLTSQFLVAQLL